MRAGAAFCTSLPSWACCGDDEEVLAQADRVANRIWGYIEETTLYDVVRGAAGATLCPTWPA